MLVEPDPPPVGVLLREWRRRRRLSQLDLALDAEVSPRYVSLVETGKSNPSREMVLRLAERLGVPLRFRNRLLIAAGFAPVYGERPLDGPDMIAAREVLRQLLRGHEPFPALALDRRWTIVEANDAATLFFDGVDPSLLEPPVNMMRVGLHPKGLASRIVNLREVRAVMLGRLARQLDATGDPVVAALHDEIQAYADPPTPARVDQNPSPQGIHQIATPIRVRHGDAELSLFSTITSFGTPLDITLDELVIESFFPADDLSARALRAVANRSRVPESPSAQGIP